LTVFIRNCHETACRTFGSEIGSLGAFPFVFFQVRLGVEKVGTERSAVHEEMNDAFCLAGKMSAKGKLSRSLQAGGKPE
jgi:hypothetical protein